MRIDFHDGSHPISDAGAAAGAKPGVRENSRDATASANDEAQLSNSQSRMNKLTLQAMQLPEVRSSRIETLRQAIQNGEYQPQPEQIADAMISNPALQV